MKRQHRACRHDRLVRAHHFYDVAAGIDGCEAERAGFVGKAARDYPAGLRVSKLHALARSLAIARGDRIARNAPSRVRRDGRGLWRRSSRRDQFRLMCGELHRTERHQYRGGGAWDRAHSPSTAFIGKIPTNLNTVSVGLYTTNYAFYACLKWQARASVPGREDWGRETRA